MSTTSTPDFAGTGSSRLPGGRRFPGLALLVIASCELILLLDSTIVNIALPSIQTALHFSSTQLAWVVNAFALAFGGLLLLGSRAGDILGRRRMLISGILLFTVASLVGGFAGSGWLLLVARAAQGVGAAFAAPNTLALLMTNFEEGAKRNRALGVYSAISGSGMALGLILGGVLTAVGSWRLVMFINVPIGLAVAVLAPLSVAEAERHTGRFDILGVLTSTLGMTALVYAFVRFPDHGWGDGVALTTLGVGVVLLAAFFVVETKTAQPMIPLRLFRDRNRASAYFNMLLVPATLFGMYFFLTQFLQEVLAFNPIQAGLSFLPLAAAFFLSAGACTKLLPKLGAKPIATAGVALVTVAIAWLSTISADSGYLGTVLGPMVLFGLGIGFAVVPLNVIITTGVAPGDSGAASGSLQALNQIGGSLGLAILVTVFGTSARTAPTTPGASAETQAHEALAHGIGYAYLAGAIFSAVALVIVLIGIRAGKPAAEQAEVPELAES